MMMAKKKVNSKVLTQAKKRRRRMLTTMRMVRYGVNNFSRNAWLTVAATAIMTITLLIIFTTFVARDILANTVQSIQNQVEMTVYIKPDANESLVKHSQQNISKLESVKSVSVRTPDQARDQFINENNSDAGTLNSLNNSEASFPWRLRISMVDINDTDELRNFVENDERLQDIISTDTPPSFAGPHRDAIKQIGGWMSFAEKAGIAVGVVFVVISSLIIFNTIRMAIFNRREEIQMMKLIGAERSFIRGPFLVEAVVYGFMAAIVATGLGIFGVHAARDVMEGNGIAIAETADWLVAYSPFVLMVMIVIGAIIGIISSLLATQRYLKI